MKRRIMAGMLVLAGVYGGFGCASKNGGMPPEEPPEALALRETLQRLSEGGHTNEMIMVLDAAITNAALTSYRPYLFRHSLGLRLDSDAVAAAQDRYWAALTEPDLRDAGFGMIEERLMRRKAYAELSTWTDRLLTADWPDEWRREIVYRGLTANRLADDMQQAAVRLPDRLKSVPPDSVPHVLRRFLDDLVAADKESDLTLFLDALDAMGERSAPVALLAKVYRIKGLVRHGRMTEAVKVYGASIGDMSKAGREGASLLHSLVRNGQGADDIGKVDALCEAIVTSRQADKDLIGAAAAHAVRLAHAQSKPVALVRSRLARARALEGESVARSLGLARDVMYGVLERGNEQDHAAIMAFCEDLLKSAATAFEKSSAAALLLDAAFLVEDFDRAASLVGMQELDFNRESRDLLAVKIKAHQAEARKQHRDAILYYRQFMQKIEQAERNRSEGEDPVTGLAVSREEVLGLNAERIARLWKDAGNPEKSAAARREAHGYYRAALERVEKDSAEYKAILKKMQKVE
jgi:hypothetical protein